MSEEIPKFIVPGFAEEQQNIMQKLQPYIDQYTLAKLKLQQLKSKKMFAPQQEKNLEAIIGWCTEQIQEMLKL